MPALYRSRFFARHRAFLDTPLLGDALLGDGAGLGLCGFTSLQRGPRALQRLADPTQPKRKGASSRGRPEMRFDQVRVPIDVIGCGLVWKLLCLRSLRRLVPRASPCLTAGVSGSPSRRLLFEQSRRRGVDVTPTTTIDLCRREPLQRQQ